MKKYKDILANYLPGDSEDIIIEWIISYRIHLKITRHRTTKLGDYRPPVKNHGHRISVNHNLNQYAFLITLVHEIAHLIVWEKHKNKVKPHGREWKQHFYELMQPFLKGGIFPDEMKKPLENYLGNSKASSVSDLELTRILKTFDNNNTPVLENLPEGAVFKLPGGRSFRKMNKLRKRYRCICLENNRAYLINPLAEVVRIDQ